ncbi:MAG TPA: hypothetical protein PLN21_17775 [Gemmatales bacterium]|nr:hypothetical protein [Gemmatales bacterium]
MDKATSTAVNHHARTHNVLSRVFLGGTSGLMLLFVGNWITSIVVSMMGGWHIGSSWWDYGCWSAAYGLPLAFVLGAVAALLFRRSKTIHLRLVEFPLYSLISAFLSIMQKPAIARLRVGRPIPLYEIVPTVMAAFFGLLALSFFAWLLIYHLWRKRKQPSHDVKSS